MVTMPEVRRSELNAVRRFLTSLHDEPGRGEVAGALQGAGAPLRRRLQRVRSAGRTAALVRPVLNAFA